MNDIHNACDRFYKLAMAPETREVQQFLEQAYSSRKPTKRLLLAAERVLQKSPLTLSEACAVCKPKSVPALYQHMVEFPKAAQILFMAAVASGVEWSVAARIASIGAEGEPVVGGPWCCVNGDIDYSRTGKPL